ncbi:unnamed protein product [Malus baccata var. baccata]
MCEFSCHFLIFRLLVVDMFRDYVLHFFHCYTVSHMLEVGKTLIQQDAPQCHQYRFGFHQPPFNSVNHLHLHCFALPYTPRWKCIKYLSVGSIGFVEAEKLLGKIKPLPPVISKV